jgi:hypothetical protein
MWIVIDLLHCPCLLKRLISSGLNVLNILELII